MKPHQDLLRSFDDYIFLNRWALTVLGLWNIGERTESRFTKVLHRTHIAVLYLMLTLLLVPQWLDLYVLWGNVGATAENFVLNVFTITAFLKLKSCVEKAHIFHDVLETIRRNWNETMGAGRLGEKKHEQILLEMARNASNYTRRYCLLMYSTAVMYFISPFVGMQGDDLRIRKYPFFGWYYFDRFSDLYYGLCYASQVMIGGVVGTTNFAMDSIFLVVLYHHSAQLRILQLELMKVGEPDNCTTDKITCLIRRHQLEIRNSQKLEAIFNGLSMQQLLVSCIIICVIGFKLIIALENGGYEFLIYVAFLLLALLQILLYCQPGDELLSQSLRIGDAAYQSSWISLDLLSMRKVTMMILRSQRPLTISAGKLYVLSLKNFTMATTFMLPVVFIFSLDLFFKKILSTYRAVSHPGGSLSLEATMSKQCEFDWTDHRN